MRPFGIYTTSPIERWPAPTFSQLKVGCRHFDTNVAVDVWLDDLAFGDQPIACPPKM